MLSDVGRSLIRYIRIFVNYSHIFFLCLASNQQYIVPNVVTFLFFYFLFFPLQEEVGFGPNPRVLCLLALTAYKLVRLLLWSSRDGSPSGRPLFFKSRSAGNSGGKIVNVDHYYFFSFFFGGEGKFWDLFFFWGFDFVIFFFSGCLFIQCYGCWGIYTAQIEWLSLRENEKARGKSLLYITIFFGWGRGQFWDFWGFWVLILLFFLFLWMFVYSVLWLLRNLHYSHRVSGRENENGRLGKRNKSKYLRNV